LREEEERQGRREKEEGREELCQGAVVRAGLIEGEKGHMGQVGKRGKGFFSLYNSRGLRAISKKIRDELLQIEMVSERGTGPKGMGIEWKGWDILRE
jgi:hypothetical protein